MWLIAMARDAVTQWRATGWMAGPAERRAAPADALEAVALLGDPEREVVVLRLLLGHSLAHTAHLSGYSQRAVLQLQLAACLAIRSLTGGPAGSPDRPDDEAAARALELERLLERWDVDVAGDDVELATRWPSPPPCGWPPRPASSPPPTPSSSGCGRSCSPAGRPATAAPLPRRRPAMAGGRRRPGRAAAPARRRRSRPAAACGSGP